MRVPRTQFTQNDFAILVITIDVYIESLQLPHLYPEHSAYYLPLLQNLRSILWALVKIGWEGDFLLTEPQVIALDEAVQGFIRICHRCKQGERGYPRTVAVLTRLHNQLEQLKLPALGKQK